jgi:hypothetical protein
MSGGSSGGGVGRDGWEIEGGINGWRWGLKDERERFSFQRAKAKSCGRGCDRRQEVIDVTTVESWFVMSVWFSLAMWVSEDHRGASATEI